MNIKEKLDFNFKMEEGKLIIYKEFPSSKLYDLLLEVRDLEYVYNELNKFGEQVANGNEKIKNLILTALLKNYNQAIKKIENSEINDKYEVNIYYTNYKEVEHLLEKINKRDIVIELGL
jgi:hypothetical protein